MEAGLLSAILGLVTVQGETAMLDLDLQKVAFLSDVGRSSDSGPGPSNPQPIPEQIQQGPQEPPGSALPLKAGVRASAQGPAGSEPS